ncbi:MAG: restriction endonuclease subunit S [Sulfurimonas sp.]|jgi:type I restriction enzyme S subunit|nr:restriction endonuclease subunit S [Sulfurimonas sp.]
MSENMKNSPKLRFPEFVNNGEWEEQELGKLGKFLGGGTPSKSVDEYWHGTIPWISSSDINEDDLKTISITRFINEKSVLESATKIVPKESVLFVSRVGTGELAINSIDLCTSQDFTNFIPIQIYNYFLGYYFLANKSALTSLDQGTSIKGFSKSDLEKFKLTYPKKKEEQQKITDCLSSVDSLIFAQSKKVELLKEHKKGLMQQLFPQDGEEVPKLRFPEFVHDGEWEEKRLGDISDVRDGTHDSPKFYSSGKPLVTSKNLLSNGILDINNVSLISEEDYEQINKRSLVNIGDILFGMIGTIGNPVRVKFDGFAIKNVALIKEKNMLLNEYLVHFLNSEYIATKFSILNAGNTQKFIALGQIRNLLLPIPKLPEQQKIADCLSSLDEQISQQTTKLQTLKEHKKALMQQLFPSKEVKI